MTPLMVLGAARSGTTLLMRLLAAHPEIVAFEEYPLECRIFQLALMPSDENIRAATEAILGACPQQPTTAYALGVYSQLASAAGKTARYFAEKQRPQNANAALGSGLNPRFLCVLRDPRDVLLSARAFDKRRGFQAFQERDGDTDETVIDKYAILFQALMNAAERTHAKIVRYEDIALDAASVLQQTFGWLGLDANVAEQAVIAAHKAEGGEHITSRSLLDSTGRWKREMPSELVSLFEQRMGPILQALGYAPY